MKALGPGVGLLWRNSIRPYFTGSANIRPSAFITQALGPVNKKPTIGVYTRMSSIYQASVSIHRVSKKVSALSTHPGLYVKRNGRSSAHTHAHTIFI